MVEYDPHRWWSQLFRVKGSAADVIVGRVLLCVVWAGVATELSLHIKTLQIPATLHALSGVAVSLLLVFRTNASYDRFWEGRKLWGGIVNETRNLARASGVFLRSQKELYRSLLLWTAAFPYATAAVLRGKVDLGPVTAALPPGDVEEVRGAQHVALAVSQRMSQLLDRGRREGHYGEYVQMQLDQNVQQLVDHLGACERIHKTPVPFAYMIHLRRALVVYCYTLPFAMVDSLGFATVPAVFLVAYLFFGIEEIGVEIEDPFGHDENDLPLEGICETIRANLVALVDEKHTGASIPRAGDLDPA